MDNVSAFGNPYWCYILQNFITGTTSKSALYEGGGLICGEMLG